MSNVKELEINETVYDIIGKGVVNQRDSSTAKVWVGTNIQYGDIGTLSSDTIYYRTDDGGTVQTAINATNATNSTNATNATNDSNGNNIVSTYATKAELAQKSSGNLFDFKWTDYELGDMNWLRADTFSWQDGTVYSNAYDHLLNDVGYVRYMVPDDDLQIKFYRAPDEDTEMYAWTNQFSTLYTVSEFPQNGDDFYYHNQVFGTVLSTGVELGSDAVTPTTETVGSYTITYYPCADGHKIVEADQETTVSNIYSESGVAWYYILDTTNQRFKLPRENPARELLKNIAPVASHSYSTTAPSIQYTNVSDLTSQGVYLRPSSDTFNARGTGNESSPGQQGETRFFADLSQKTGVYKGKQYLYFYVGQFSQTATEQTAGLNANLFNGKADLDMGNVPSNIGSTAKSYFAGIGMPSDTYEDFTLPASGDSKTAPANGYYIFRKTASAAGQFLGLQNKGQDGTKIIADYTLQAYATNMQLAVTCPAKKGDQVQFGYNTGGASILLRFVYAEGEV